MDKDRLILVETDEQWQFYHEIRGQVLFGEDGYDAHHPDDRAKNNHPVLLLADGEAVGAMRIDLVPDRGYAIMRTVAIREEFQRQRYGTTMLALAESFALDRGYHTVVTIATLDAVLFYEKCGYVAHNWDVKQLDPYGRQMRKLLTVK